MKVYSFRAECRNDLDRFLALLREKGCHYLLDRAENPPEKGLAGLDTYVELRSPLEKGQLLNVLQEVEDGHVMVETFEQCPLEHNELRRTYGR